MLGFQGDAHGMTINAGTGKDYSVNYLADLVSDKRVEAPARPFDLRRTLAGGCGVLGRARVAAGVVCVCVCVRVCGGGGGEGGAGWRAH